MAGTILANTIALPDRRAAIGGAVLAGMNCGTGSWQAEILANQGSAGFQIYMSGPKGKEWSEIFEGPGESEPEYIRQTIKRAILSFA